MKLTRIAMAAALIVALAACHQGRSIRPNINPEFTRLTKEQLFEKGEALYARKRYSNARTYFSYVYENYPNDPLGRRALLRVADSYFAQGDAVNLVEAQYKYRDFINRYPGSDRADYAMLQIAMVSYKQMERPDRDQQKTREALEKFNDMLKSYPRSSLVPEAQKRLADVQDRLAKHEHIIARFYMRRHSYVAAIQRLNGLVNDYPNYNQRDAVFFDLGTSLASMGRTAEARLYFERVLSEFPKSDYAQRAKHRLDQMKAA